MATRFGLALARRLPGIWASRGPLAIALLPLALLFGMVTAVRRHLYRIGVMRSTRLPVPVIVIGNLIAGGAGKTPTVMATVSLLRRNGYYPGIVSRGYGGTNKGVLVVSPDSSSAECGDEPLLMKLRTGAPLVVGADRVSAARCLLRDSREVDVIVSDDGLQHSALMRDAQVLVFDERGAGNGWLLPAGPLREPMPQAVGRTSVVLYNTATASTPLPGTLARTALIGAVLLHDWRRGEPAAASCLADLKGRPLIAVAGIARPERFFAMLRECGLDFTPLPLPDHHRYDALPWPAGTPDVIVTEKDAVKLDAGLIGTTRVWVAPLDFIVDAAFEASLLALLPPPGHRHGNTPA